jgi:hypothetical protein
LNRTERQYSGSGITSTTSQYTEDLHSRQRFDIRRRRLFTAKAPVLQQLLFMHHRPFLQKVPSARRQLPFEDLLRAGVDGYLKLAVSGVKMAAPLDAAIVCSQFSQSTVVAITTSISRWTLVAGPAPLPDPPPLTPRTPNTSPWIRPRHIGANGTISSAHTQVNLPAPSVCEQAHRVTRFTLGRAEAISAVKSQCLYAAALAVVFC